VKATPPKRASLVSWAHTTVARSRPGGWRDRRDGAFPPSPRPLQE